METENKVLKVSEIAKELRMSEQTIRNMIKRGDLKAIQSGRTIRIPATELDRLLTGGNIQKEPLKKESAQLTTEPAEGRAKPLPDSWKK